MNSHVGPLVSPMGVALDHQDDEQSSATDQRGLPVITQWGLAATASAGLVRLDVDEALTGEGYVATLSVGSTQVRFRMDARGTIAAMDRFLAGAAASELSLGWRAVITRDDEFAGRLFLRVGYADAGVTVTLTGQALADCAACVTDVAAQLA